ncbi:carbonate dehydratase [Cladophialophora yegresii CBS 114405]|uniref:Carbonate dehydratase n=1 Tax=Cladophialophora yegresii CBS 114405 TaxID=1182544 RepID=W9WUG2_9EURO|nr:carbonate dehydratase [Cladophialophora yegresii CBS 114405]EXJ61929.1 carbonate dehydratase [Cladophialophora yegresii CBS 114405]
MRAAVFRNAGGRVTEDVIRSLHILRAVVSLELVAIVHHTDCGMSHATDQEVRAFAKPKTAAAAAVVDKMDFGMWKEEHLDETVKEDIRKLREETSLGDLEVLGFVLDTQKGAVREVET